jgi:enoyl-[acyl-carrier protein] reductase II
MTRRFEEMEKQSLTQDQLIEFGTGKLKSAAVDGDVAEGSFMAGQSCGLVNDVVPCAELIQRVIAQAEDTLRRLSRYTVSTGGPQ